MIKLSHIEKCQLISQIDDYFVINIDGCKVQAKEDAISLLTNAFNIRDIRHNNWDALFDRLQREDYIKPDKISILISNYEVLLENEEKSKQIFLDILSEIVAWWEGDVEKYVVGGKKKEFNVYLVD